MIEIVSSQTSIELITNRSSVDLVTEPSVVDFVTINNTIEVVSNYAVIEFIQGRKGPKGDTGPSGVSEVLTLTVIAARALSAHRVVTPQSDGRIDYADALDVACASRPLWLTFMAVDENAETEVITMGSVTSNSWSWVIGEPIFLGQEGYLTQVVPESPEANVTVQIAGPMLEPDSLFFAPRDGIVHGGASEIWSFALGFYGDPDDFAFSGGFLAGFHGAEGGDAFAGGFETGFQGHDTYTGFGNFERGF